MLMVIARWLVTWTLNWASIENKKKTGNKAQKAHWWNQCLLLTNFALTRDSSIRPLNSIASFNVSKKRWDFRRHDLLRDAMTRKTVGQYEIDRDWNRFSLNLTLTSQVRSPYRVSQKSTKLTCILPNEMYTPLPFKIFTSLLPKEFLLLYLNKNLISFFNLLSHFERGCECAF